MSKRKSDYPSSFGLDGWKKKRPEEEIIEEIRYTRGRYKDAMRERKFDDAAILNRDIEELLKELDEV